MARKPDDSGRLDLRLAGRGGLPQTTEERLATANERLEVVARATSDAVWDWDLVDGTMWWNETFSSLFGYPAAIAPRLEEWQARLYPEDAPRIIGGLQAVIDAGGTFWSDEFRFRRADGSWADVLDRGTVIHDERGRPVRMIGSMVDISERKRGERAQAALYRIAATVTSAATLQDLLRSIHEIVSGLMPAKNFYIALHDPATGTIEFPYFVDEIDSATPPRMPLGRGVTAYVLRTGQSVLLTSQEDFDVLVQRGEVELLGAPSVSWLGVPLRTGDRTVGVIAAQSYSPGVRYGARDKEILEFVSTQVARTIERKQAEEALRESERRFRALIENSTDGIIVASADGAIRFRSASASRILGYTGGDRAPAGFGLFHPDDRPELLRRRAEADARPGTAVPFQSRALHRDGSWRTLEGTIVNLLADPAVAGVVVNFRDITERKRFEAQLMAADRMVSVGTLAAGVAHEINNPLAYVIANLSYTAEWLRSRSDLDDREVSDAVAAAQDGAERVRRIVRDLKTFSRGDEGEGQDEPVDVHQVLEAAIDMAWNEIRHRARLIRDYAPSLPPVLASAGRLGQVFVNLLINAAQAIPGTGPEGEIRVASRVEDGRVVVEVSDSGVGISPAHQAQLFDPFFTTKPVGVGTGLGLFICQNIVHSLRGRLSVDSELGEGSTFRVELPVTAAAGAHPVTVATAGAPGRHGRVLVIDDEPEIGTALRRLLAPHDVVAATSAPEGLALLRDGEPFDVVLCDLMIPNMTGMDLHAVLARESPELLSRLVFVTGGAFTAAARAFLERVPNPRLEKPFDARVVRELVDERVRARG